MRKLTLDVAKWRCGKGPNDFSSGDGVNSLGIGRTAMLNLDGYMCCLGQFAEQCSINRQDLVGSATPKGLAIRIGKKYDPAFVSQGYNHTDLAARCIQINDTQNTSVKQKIDALTTLLKEHDIELEIINGKAYANTNS